jgi:hypothetical protein
MESRPRLFLPFRERQAGLHQTREKRQVVLTDGSRALIHFLGAYLAQDSETLNPKMNEPLTPLNFTRDHPTA